MARDDASGRERTLREWLDAHRGILVRICRAYADGPDDEQDLLQEMLLALWRSLPRFRGEAKVSTWVYQVALNTALSRRRATRAAPAPDQLDEAAEPRSDGAAAAEHRLRWAAVLAALRRVSAIDRAVLLLALEGASQQEIADVLGISANHAGVKLHRARRRLGEMLEA